MGSGAAAVVNGREDVFKDNNEAGVERSASLQAPSLYVSVIDLLEIKKPLSNQGLMKAVDT